MFLCREAVVAVAHSVVLRGRTSLISDSLSFSLLSSYSISHLFRISISLIKLRSKFRNYIFEMYFNTCKHTSSNGSHSIIYQGTNQPTLIVPCSIPIIVCRRTLAIKCSVAMTGSLFLFSKHDWTCLQRLLSNTRDTYIGTYMFSSVAKCIYFP